MLDRRLEEIKLLEKEYGELEYDPEIAWILFKKFKVPSGWNKNVIELLIIIPPAYPSTAPDNFYVPLDFRLDNNQLGDCHTESPVNLIERQWGQFSYHLDGEWHPSSNILEGDNLLSFMLKVIERLEAAN